ncbi:hypothetical protein NMG60_11019181 [Bertholletia excelsa]
MSLGKRPGSLMKRTTSVTKFSFDLSIGESFDLDRPCSDQVTELSLLPPSPPFLLGTLSGAQSMLLRLLTSCELASSASAVWSPAVTDRGNSRRL